jgi:hypothetical protein
VCGKVPTALVPSAPGCVSMRVVYDSGRIYWADMGHGTISSVAVGGGPITTIVSNAHIAAIQTPGGPLNGPNGNPIATALLVHAGTVYWIGASSTVSCADAGTCSGGVGTTIMSATAGAAPKTLLAADMDPGPSPVSAVDAAFPLETPGQNPAILTIALSPDGNTLYFAAGTRFYSIPSAGAGTVTYVGYTQGPEHGLATTLTADDNYLYYPTNYAGNIEILKLGSLCDLDASPWTMALGSDEQPICPVRISESQGGLVYDNIQLRGGSLYWGNDTSVWKGDVSGAIAAAITGGLSGGQAFPDSLYQTSLTSWALGTQYAYFAEPGQDSVCSQDHATPCVGVSDDAGDVNYVCEASPASQACVTLGYIEKGIAPPFEGGTPPNAIVVARDQAAGMSIALDGTNVYWTTSNCDINFIADSPQ